MKRTAGVKNKKEAVSDEYRKAPLPSYIIVLLSFDISLGI